VQKVSLQELETLSSQEILSIDNQNFVVHKGKLFNINTGEYYKPSKFTKKQKRQLMRIRSGSEIAVAKGEMLCFMTLSTQYDIVKSDGKPVKDACGRSIPANPRELTQSRKELNHAYQTIQDYIEYYLTAKTYEKRCKKTALDSLRQEQ
jgi:hypothetical protein